MQLKFYDLFRMHCKYIETRYETASLPWTVIKSENKKPEANLPLETIVTALATHPMKNDTPTNQAETKNKIKALPLKAIDDPSPMRPNHVHHCTLLKGQYAVEQNFTFLKDPLIVNDIFLKTPGRIDALAMILIIALMAVRLMQLRMREYLEAEGKSVVGLNDKLTDESTYYAFMCAMRYVQIIVYEGRARLMNKNQDLTDKQRAYLEALGLDETVFFDSTALPRAIISLNSSE